ncbi:exonuclease family protein [Lelliottia wanjuensis]|uniref:exodeoxyribonuclease VIII n=1 Tax=Lelliottia wanjuensis TaxID=3050585 RepID=UPI0025512301|nr:exodeoxyribonuclease VIII [Lelliottia sp. V86_10]MDK9585454.1 exodeoxyribonuclease VIII [Lelliottia sp. V86_10]
MSVELKVFPGAYLPKDKALKEFPDLKPLAMAVRAINKGVAEVILTGEFAKFLPEHMNNYFKVKIWEHREELPCPGFDALSPVFFETVAVWNAKTGEPMPLTVEPGDNGSDQDDGAPTMKLVSLLDLRSRTACLVRFGVVEEITSAQHDKIIDLIENDNGSIQYQTALAFNEELRVLDLTAEQLEDLQAWIRQTFDTGAQSPEIQVGVTGWINDLESATGSNNEDAGPDEQTRLRYNIARGRIARSMDFDINSTPIGIEQRANSMLCNKNDTEISSWFLPLSRTPGVYDLHPAAIISMVKTCDDHLHIYPGELRKYIDAFIASNDCINPDPLLVDIACGRSSLPVPHQETTDEETRPLPPGEADAPANKPLSDKEFNADIDRAIREQAATDEQTSKQLAAERGEFVPGISDPSDPKWVDGSEQPKIENLGGGVFSVDALMGQQPSNEVEKQEVPPALSEREFEIVTELNELLSARTNVIGQDDIDGLVSNSGHSISQLIPLLLVDIATTEFCLSPDLSADEIHSAATTILESWSDSADVRQKVALDDVVEYRKPAPPKSSAPVTTIRTSNDAEPEQLSAPAPTTLTYQQQLTIAALQGLCANPAYCTTSDEIPEMACLMAQAIITEEAAQ